MGAQDAEDPNPLVRALAIRTMGCIRVDKMVDYMEIPLRRTLSDDNPYVRKTAAICVAKLFDLNPQLCIEQGFVESLQKSIEDSNPMVVANAVTALADIQQIAPETRCFVVTSPILTKLLAALNECTEWGRIAILTAFSDYTDSDQEEARHICERVVPQFQHANPSVVLSAVKAVLCHFEKLPKEEQDGLLRKMGPPLVSLVSTQPEVQYVCLRNIRIILAKYPTILSREIRVFYCKYNDPPYLKLEKLEILVRLANDNNVASLLSELKEYSMEVDTDFVKNAIKAIGQIAIKFEKASGKCVEILLELLNNRINYAINQVVIVSRDILRKWPHFTKQILPFLCGDGGADTGEEILDSLEDDEARAAMIWIIGQFSNQIPKVIDKLDYFVETLIEESPVVQLQLLTTAVKIYLTQPDKSQHLIQAVLQTATEKIENADVRDRAYIYWRLLSSDTSVAKKIILADIPKIDTPITNFSPVLLNQLLRELSTIGSVYHKPASSFVNSDKIGVSQQKANLAIEELQQMAKNEIVKQAVNAENLLDFDDDIGNTSSLTAENGADKGGNILDELNDLFSTPAPSTSLSPNLGGSSNNDILSLFDSVPTQAQPQTANDPFNNLTSSFGGLSFGASSASTSKPKPNLNDDLFNF